MRQRSAESFRASRLAWSIATAVLLHCGGGIAAESKALKVCVDEASPTADIDARFAAGIAQVQQAQLVVYKYRGTPKGDDDDFELRRYKTLLAEQCDLVVGFPYLDKGTELPAFLKATTPYARTGFVLVTRQADPATTLNALPGGSHVTVAYNTLPNYFFNAHPNLVRDIEEDEPAAVEAVASGKAAGAMVWRGSVVRYLEGKHALGRFRLLSLDEPYAQYDLVALYGSDRPDVGQRFEAAVRTMRGNGALDQALGSYVDSRARLTTTSASEARALVMAQRRDASPTAPAACAGKKAAKPSGPPPALYTEAQATEGKALFADKCALCHGKQLEGMAGPSLKGKFFLPESPSHSLGDIFTIVSQNMPAMAPASLEHDQYVKIMSFLLQQNGYPAGATELTFDSAKASTVQLRPLAK